MAESTAPLGQYADVWKRKPVLRVIYGDFYDRLAAACLPGLTIEIGGGIGNLKERLGEVVATDIQFAPWLDCVADAQRLPFAASCAANIVMVDVLHHVEFPVAFFHEVERVLRPGGRLLMVEPAITWGSTLFYRLLHQEPVRTSADVLIDGRPTAGRDPYDSNQAIPTLLATRDRERFHRLFPGLADRAGRLVFVRRVSAQRRVSALEFRSAPAWRAACCRSNAPSSRCSASTQDFAC